MALLYRPLNEDELRLHTPVVITCNENRREVSAVQNIANKQIDRTFLFDKVWVFFILVPWINDTRCLGTHDACANCEGKIKIFELILIWIWKSKRGEKILGVTFLFLLDSSIQVVKGVVGEKRV